MNGNRAAAAGEANLITVGIVNHVTHKPTDMMSAPTVNGLSRDIGHSVAVPCPNRAKFVVVDVGACIAVGVVESDFHSVRYRVAGSNGRD